MRIASYALPRPACNFGTLPCLTGPQRADEAIPTGFNPSVTVMTLHHPCEFQTHAAMRYRSIQAETRLSLQGGVIAFETTRDPAMRLVSG